MFDVLVYLFENYYEARGCPDHDTLARKLHAAGFENEDITDALDWLNGLAQLADDAPTEALERSSAIRGYTSDETAKISTDGRGFIAFLESAGIVTPLLRELILERAMALSADHVGLEKLKVIVLMVLWTRRGSVDALVLDELLPEGESRRVH